LCSDPQESAFRKHRVIVGLPRRTAFVLALGDIHGDYDRLVALLVAAKVVTKAPTTPEDVDWAAGNAGMVITGDPIDKWPHALPKIASR
jgi:hypothetical protein